MEDFQASELEERKERFFISKYQLNALLESIPQIIYMVDIKGNFITGTKNAKEFVSKGIDNSKNNNLKFLQVKTNSISNNQYIIENNAPLFYDTQVVDIHGVPHWYHIYKAPINDYYNEVIGIVVIITNIDEEKLLQTQRETFVASLGHDLKNPTLAQIRAVELLLKGDFGKLSKEQQDILEMLLDSCKYMNAMLSSLLATYRSEKGVVTLNYDEINLVDLTEESIGEMVYLAKDKCVSIKVDFSCKIPYVYADKVQIKRVIMNLLSNSIKYAFKNTTIKINIYNESDYTCFSIENESPFIPPEKQEAIFAQYVSFAEAHNAFGIGLGLYTSKKIVSAHGGSISVKSFEEGRNIFYFKVPNTKGCICASKTVSF